MDPHMKNLFDQAIALAALARTEACRFGGMPSYVSADNGVRLTCAQTEATAHIFAALVQADLAGQIRTMKEKLDGLHE